MTTKVKSAISTAAFTCLVLLLMVFVSGYTYDEEENRKENPEDYNEKIPPAGFEISLGTPNVGKGSLPTPTTTNNKNTKPSPVSSQRNTPTQQQSDAKVNRGETDVVADTRTDQTKPEEPKQTVDPKALYTGRRTNTNNDGGSHGDTQTHGYGGKTGGDASSTSSTSGTGATYSFNGIGRNALALPKPEYKSNQQGKIVVKIKVDQQGKVVFVDAPAKGSTITTQNLVKQAMDAARKARFDANANAPEEQMGTITYYFVIN